MIIVYLSFAELPSWLLLSPMQKLVAETGVDIAFRAMLSSLGAVAGSNLKPGEDDPLADYKARRASARHRAAKRENERMCEKLGISPEEGGRKIDPFFLSLGLLWVTSQGASLTAQWGYLEAAYTDAFRRGEDVESLAGLQRVLAVVGISVDGLEQFIENESAALAASREEILETGVFNAPAIVLDGEIFHGREHLPLIRWILEGKQGTPPV